VTERAHTQVEIDTWGTILLVDVASSKVDEAALKAGIDEVISYVKEIDELFSPFKDSSEVSKLRRKEISIGQASTLVQEIWQLCEQAKELTRGSFDPWAVKKGFDPSGYVKGWAADKCVAILKRHGAENIQINAAGDISVAGGLGDAKPWSIGIRDPDNKFQVVKIFEVSDGAIATSGTYEIGSHITDPHTGLIAIGALSATVIGPDGGLADALATALIVDGQDGATLFTQPELADYSAWVINRHDKTAWGTANLPNSPK
jgi:thiamine biosynthesis lipoprotein